MTEAQSRGMPSHFTGCSESSTSSYSSEDATRGVSATMSSKTHPYILRQQHVSAVYSTAYGLLVRHIASHGQSATHDSQSLYRVIRTLLILCCFSTPCAPVGPYTVRSIKLKTKNNTVGRYLRFGRVDIVAKSKRV